MEQSPLPQTKRGRSDGFWGILEGGTRLRTLLLVASGAFLLVMLGDLVVPVVLGAILAAITWPLRDRLIRLLRGRVVLASLILEIGLVLGVVVPVGIVLVLAVFQLRDLYDSISSMNFDTYVAAALSLLERLKSMPRFSGLDLQPEHLVEPLKQGVPSIAGWLVGKAAGYSLGFLRSALMVALTLLCLFFMHLSGDRLAERVRNALPLPPGETAALMDVFRRTAVAILKGNFVIAAIQGFLTGLLFAVVGVPSPVFFGVVAALCSLVPSVGSALVWLPAALLLLLSGSWGAALAVVLVGALVISTIDNVLRPVLVGRETGMHDMMVLLTTLGGIAYFGAIGILFGPLAGAVFLALLERHEADAAGSSEAES